MGSALLAALLVACDGGPPPSVITAVDGARAQAQQAQRQADLLATDPAQWRGSEVEQLEAERRWLETTHTEALQRASQADEVGERARWEAETTKRALQSTLRARDEAMLRGAVEHYRHQAELEWHLSYLRDAAGKLGISPNAIPQNPYLLQPKEVLLDLEQRFVAKRNTLEKELATLDVLSRQFEIEEVDNRLASIREALKKPQEGDVVSVFKSARPSDEVVNAFLQWDAQRQSARDQELRMLEGQKLEQALAKDGSDIAIRIRLKDVAKPQAPPDVLQAARLTREQLALQRLEGFRPLPTTSQRVEDLLQNRFKDPLSAVESEALLRMQWEELLSNTETSKLLSEPLRKSFADWMVAQLSDEDLLRAKSYLGEARRHLDLMNASGVDEFTHRRDFDYQAIDEELQALDREAQFRAAHQHSRAYPPGQVLSEEARNMLGRHAAMTPDILKTDSGALAHYQALRRYEARAGRNSAADEQLRELHKKGFAHEIARLEEDVRTLREVMDQHARAGAPEDSVATRSAKKKAKDSLHKRANRLRTAIAKDARLADLLAKLNGLVPPWWTPPDDGHPPGGEPPYSPGGEPPGPQPTSSGPGPKPTSGGDGAAEPFGDPVLEKQRQIFAETKDQLREKPKPPPSISRPGGRPFIAMEANLQLRLAVKGTRPEMKGWIRSDGRTVSYDDINKLNSINDLPGGVALGGTAEVDPNLCKGCGLVYLADKKRLVLASPDGTMIMLPAVAPENLRSYLRFARDSDPVAVSIGLSPEERSGGGTTSRVLIHPALRDTQVGLDLVNADRLPWSLQETKLPDGTQHAYAQVMGPLLKMQEPNLALPVAELLKHVHLLTHDKLDLSSPTGHSQEALIQAAVKLDADAPISILLDATQKGSNSQKRVKYFKQQWKEQSKLLERLLELTKDEDPEAKAELEKGLYDLEEQGKRLVRILQATPARKEDALKAIAFLPLFNRSEIDWAAAARATLVDAGTSSTPNLEASAKNVLNLLSPSRLSLLTDGPVRVKQVGTDKAPELQFQAQLRIRYVYGTLETNEKGISKSETAYEQKEAGEKATELLPQFEEPYPTIRRTREHSAWIAFLRWALGKTQGVNNVAWIDVSALGETPRAVVPTPDFMCRGNNVADCAREFGL